MRIIAKILKKHNFLNNIVRLIYKPIKWFKLRHILKKYKKIGLEKIEHINKKERNIFYFGVPIHCNMGDLAQYYCIKKWFKENYTNYTIYEFETYCTYNNLFIKKLKEKIKNEDLIFFQSGYCTKEIHLDHYMHRKIVFNFRQNKIVFFPQTVNFASIRQLKKTASIYGKHPNLIFLARDQKSYEVSKKYFNNKVVLFPDIVTTLIGSMKKNENRYGVLLCLRNDGEKLYSKESMNVLEDLKIKYGKVDICDTSSPYDYDFTMNNLENVLFEMLEKFSLYKLIITDRYHGTIFSLISNTNVIIIPTNDHKVVTGADWFKGIYDVNVSKNPENAREIAEKIDNFDIYNKEYFITNYYKKLKKIIED